MAEGTNVAKGRDPVTCYVSAPMGTDVEWIREPLRRRGVRLTSPSPTGGDDLYATVADIIGRCDLVIGVLTELPSSKWVAFELGMAAALKRRIVVFAGTADHTNLGNLARYLVLRVERDNREAVEFALDQILAAPRQGDSGESEAIRPSAGLGVRAEPLIRDLGSALSRGSALELERVVSEAILAFDHEAAVRPRIQDQEADIGVWSDRLVDSVGCPLLVEVKQRLGREGGNVLRRYAEMLRRCGAPWGLLVYGEGPAAQRRWSQVAPTVLTISARDLLERMRNESFADIVVSLRNRRVHHGDY